jgi:hypothetical protein
MLLLSNFVLVYLTPCYAQVIVLASTTASRRLKYVWGLAAGCPVVHYSWIDKCKESGKKVPLIRVFLRLFSRHDLLLPSLERCSTRQLNLLAMQCCTEC